MKYILKLTKNPKILKSVHNCGVGDPYTGHRAEGMHITQIMSSYLYLWVLVLALLVQA